MTSLTPGWVKRFLIGIAVCVGVAIYQAYKVALSGIPLWDKIGIFAIQFACIAGLIWSFLYYYAKYRGLSTNLNDRLFYVAIMPPLIVLGILSAYLILPPFLDSISFSHNSTPLALSKIILFVTVAFIAIANIFYPRK